MSEKLSDKERFFSKVSHDLRGSFTGILGFSDILNYPNEKLSNDEILEYTSRIAKQSHESFELLVNFINWLKMEDYDYGLTYEKLDLVEAIHEIYQYHKKEFTKKNIRLSLDSGDSVYVNMDHEILGSILKNIFSFLLKHNFVIFYAWCANAHISCILKHLYLFFYAWFKINNITCF